MRKFINLLLCLATSSVGFSQYNNPVFSDSLSNKNTFELNGGLSIQGTSIRKDFFNTLIFGGFIDQNTKDRSMNKHSETNRFGISSINELTWIAGKSRLFKNDSLTWQLKGGISAVGNMSYSDDAFRLAFYGNSSFANDTVDFSGSQVNLMVFEKIGFGIVSKKSHSSLTLSLANIQQAVRGDIRNGELSQNADFSQINARLRGDFSFTDSKSFSNGLGIVIDGNYRFVVPWVKESTTTFEFSAQNIGVAYMYNGMKTYSFDTSFQYTGFELSKLIDGSTRFGSDFSILDSLGIKSTSEKQWLVMPGFIQAAKLVDPNSDLKVQSFFGIRLFPTIRVVPSVYAGAYWKVIKPLAVSVNVAYGGFGSFRTGIYASYQCPLVNITVGTDDTIGLISKSGFGQAVVIQSIWKL